MSMLRLAAACAACVFAAPAAASSPEAPPIGADAAVDAEAVVAPLAVLSAADAALYEEIFALQEDGNWREADALIAQLGDDLLMGHVLYQRYMHPTAWRSSFDELKRWMAYYADHPRASDVYSLALKRRPKNASPPVRPAPRKWRKTAQDYELHPLLEADYAETSRPRLAQIEGRVRYLSRREEAMTALKEIDAHLARRTITERQYDRMRSWIAASLYYQGYVDSADSIAEEAAARNGETAVLAHWIGGLIAFRKEDMARAYDHFAAQAAVPYQDEALRAAGAFWAARAALAAGRLDAVTPALETAADHPFTFYGQLALSQLGRAHDYDWSSPAVAPARFERLGEAIPAVRRAVGLVQANQRIEADLELRWANGVIEDDQEIDLLAVAAALDLPAAQVDIAETGRMSDRAAALFPIPHFEPAGGFRTDRALLYALMRQESKFKVEATSRVGARGLMQLMPRTASYVAKDRSLAQARGSKRLYDPAFNLELGQSYVAHLISTAAGGDLFAMAVAYNGGPGNLRRWRRDLELDDPLLFIESIPNAESRDFVEKVLTNFWIYQARLGQPTPTRDLVAAGSLPLYEALDQIAGEDEVAEVSAGAATLTR